MEDGHISMWVKCKVYIPGYSASSLLYGAETWTFYKAQVDKSHAYMMRHLWQVMSITQSLFDKIRNEEILRNAGRPFMMKMFVDRNLR